MLDGVRQIHNFLVTSSINFLIALGFGWNPFATCSLALTPDWWWGPPYQSVLRIYPDTKRQPELGRHSSQLETMPWPMLPMQIKQKGIGPKAPKNGCSVRHLLFTIRLTRRVHPSIGFFSAYKALWDSTVPSCHSDCLPCAPSEMVRPTLYQHLTFIYVISRSHHGHRVARWIPSRAVRHDAARNIPAGSL
jgi:hypothetical protein